VAKSILRNTTDAYISSASPNKTFSGARLYVKANNPDTRNGYVFYGRPFPLGSKIISAVFSVWNGSQLEGPGNTIVSVSRIGEPWKKSTLRWSNRPVSSGPVNVSKSGTISKNTRWDIDLTSMMQSVSNGADFFGLEFSANDGKGEWFHSGRSPRANRRPVLVIQWAEPIPDEPEISQDGTSSGPDGGSPSNGNAISEQYPVFTFSYTSDDEETDLDALEVQTFSAEDPLDSTTLVWDSGWVASVIPELDSSTTSYLGVANDQIVWWRFRFRDESGQQSGWSDVMSFTRKPLPIVTITNPAASPNNFVSENTPPISWSFSGMQRHWQVLLIDNESNNDVVWRSAKTTSADDATTIPAGIIQDDKFYRVTVRVWDDAFRQGNGGEPPFSSSTRDFTVKFAATVAPVTNLTANRVAPWHWAKITWNRSTQPDFWEVYRGSVMVGRYEGNDLLASGTSYEIIRRDGSPREDTVWRVVPIVNGKGSLDNPTVMTDFAATSAVLSELDGSNVVMFLNYNRNQDDYTTSTVHDTVGDGPPVLIRQSNKGNRGTFTGVLVGGLIPGVSGKGMRDRFNQLKRGEGREVLLTVLDETMKVFINDAEIQAGADNEGLFYNTSFDYYQTDFR